VAHLIFLLGGSHFLSSGFRSVAQKAAEVGSEGGSLGFGGVAVSDAARAVGLAPAHGGEPGYWTHYGQDGNGSACESFGARR
jgi:hypothetical protein